ncbi:D-alanyl-D-alanine carboxypeptidase, penicillin-binding protein 5 [Luminiphilus syltensis NOR5-1B]|uniref:serine-type D-Ala-D-Ala carboxypeptidase n=1 Tax=Luminiphilus syltensis NOR5-1B TaxID=565045 RepID=B8KSL7_9GAMM|nr:D-alanyl-D-alanine carboxypeptidase family protein [Luminiphilus syltensis]EED34133.1 D-alanyl-D-alanine carboxypeptidase, penicillin-binding protein 5 [Luminiphilus syltensis NOR5-1B]
MLRFVILMMFSTSVLASSVVPAPPSIAADGYLLMDFHSGEVLVEHNADDVLPPASLTKMMTAYILAEEIDAGRLSLSDEVPVSRTAWSQNPTFRGSSLMWIEPGKTVTVGELEKGIVISSGNDATVAIAEHIAGSEEAFAGMMNRYAEILGMTATHYVNSHGLPNSAHVTSARDLATLAAAIIRDHPERYKVYKQLSFTYNDITQYNRNHLLRDDPSVDGLKTGYTSVAGYGLVASAERDGMRLISVVMGSNSTRSRKAETRSLLNYGFRFYETVQPVVANVALASTRLWKGLDDAVAGGVLESSAMTIPRGSAQPEVVVTFNEPIEAPLSRGDVIGEVEVRVAGEAVGRESLVALADAPEAGFFKRLWDALTLWFTGLFK